MTWQELVENCGVPKPIIAKRVGLMRDGAPCRQVLDNWLRRGQVPANRVIALERATGVPREKIRPDIYPPNGRGRHGTRTVGRRR